MNFQHDIDFTTLSWIKSELDATLQQARIALEAYVENPADSAQMRECVNHLHLVHGTLRMVELYGAAMVVVTTAAQAPVPHAWVSPTPRS